MKTELSSVLDTMLPWFLWCLLAILAVGVIIVIILIIMGIWSKCKRFIVRPLTEEEIKEQKEQKRIQERAFLDPFEDIKSFYVENTSVHLWKDNATNIMYIFTSRYNGGTVIAPMVNVDGKPLLYEDWKQKIDENSQKGEE